MKTDSALSDKRKEAIQEFLARYRHARTAQTARLAQELNSWFGQILGEVEIAKRQRAKQARLLAPNFNILNVLGVADKEFVHSNFLGELLDPFGTHGQGILFLAGFLDLCERARGTASSLAANLDLWADDVWVRREAAIFRGRFDLLVHAPGRLCVVIENKIDAPEGEAQLARYRDWLVRRPEPPQAKLLVFLTKEGVRAKKSGEKIRDGEYVRLSYVNDIWKWLEECRTEARPVQSVIDQYLGLLAQWRKMEDAGADSR